MGPAWYPRGRRGPNPGPRRLPCRDRRARQPLVQDSLAVKPSEQRVFLYWRSVVGVEHGMRIARHASLGLLLSALTSHLHPIGLIWQAFEMGTCYGRTNRLSGNLARNVAIPSSRHLPASSIAVHPVCKTTTTLEGIPISQQGAPQAV